MDKLKKLKPERVFYYFEKLSSIPRGSGNMKKIADFCEDFAKEHNLKCHRDSADNVIIFKEGTDGYEESEPVILQGHLDMVCQKTEDSDINFETDTLDLYIDGDFVKAHNTTLGADNGIAVAVILAILEADEYSHPPIEAVFTVDEEVGMLGAMALDMSLLNAKKMINLDSEEEGIVTVSCAGGGDFNVTCPVKRNKAQGVYAKLLLKGLKGGHSGMEINSGRVNADILMGRVLDELKRQCNFDIISLTGGDKANAIPNRAEAELCVYDVGSFKAAADNVFDTIKAEISHRESDFAPEVVFGESGEFEVYDSETSEKLVTALLCVPGGVMDMSAEIDGLVETSLNLGILKDMGDSVYMGLSLRSNKKTAMEYLKRRLDALFKTLGCKTEVSGVYPPWEYKENSVLQNLYCDVYKKLFNKEPQVAAIHAGLECGVFSSGIEGMECISIGPEMFDVHTVSERLSIASTERFFDLITEILKNLK